VIDFRYHLVSIVSIFMALAVGIVLGAGPLKGQIGDTLNQEVTQLRTDRATLRTDLEAARKAGTTRDELVKASRTRLVGGTLTDRTVALVILPGADADDVKGTSDMLAAAGAKVVSRTTVNDSWVPADDAATEAQRTLGTELRRSLGLTEEPAPGTSPLNDVLAAGLIAPGAPEPSDAGKRALDRLVEEDLIDLDTADLVRANAAVLLAAPVEGGTSEVRDRVAVRLAQLALATDRAGDGAVLASDVGITGFSGASSVVRAARGDARTSRELSTVDDVSTATGQVSVVWALAQQLADGVGQYGLGDGVSAGFPPVPAA